MTCDISREYFDWVCGFVYSANAYRKNYHFSKLLSRLYETDFYWLLDDDANRAADGDVLRYRFMDARYPSAPPVKFFDEKPTSVLEVLIGLSVRFEEQIMVDPEVGNRTGEWFWSMIMTMGLGHMDDDHYDAEQVDYILRRFLDRQYEPNGEGSIFKTKRNVDMREVGLWLQMSWYLVDNYV